MAYESQWCSTVGELIAYLKQFPTDTPILEYKRDMEKRGYFQGVRVSYDSFEEQEREGVDAFDGTKHTYKCWASPIIKRDNLWNCVSID